MQQQKPPKKLLDLVREATRLKPYSYHTEESYVYWVYRQILINLLYSGFSSPNTS